MKRLLTILAFLTLLIIFLVVPSGAQEPVAVPLEGTVSTQIPPIYL